IGMGRPWRKPCRSKQGRYRGLLADAQFDHDMALRLQQVDHLSRDGAIASEPIGSAIERPARIMADFGWKRCDVATHDIGWVRHHEIERLRQCGAEIACNKM